MDRTASDVLRTGSFPQTLTAHRLFHELANTKDSNVLVTIRERKVGYFAADLPYLDLESAIARRLDFGFLARY